MNMSITAESSMGQCCSRVKGKVHGMDIDLFFSFTFSKAKCHLVHWRRHEGFSKINE